MFVYLSWFSLFYYFNQESYLEDPSQVSMSKFLV